MYIELSDKQWEAIPDYLPPVNMNGRPRCEDRSVINGILYVLKTGCPWPAIPKEYGVHYSTCWRRLKRWEENGTWQRIIEALLEAREAEMAQVALDTSVVKAKKGGACVGQTHGGKTTKRSIMTRTRGRPVGALVFAGNYSDFKTALPTVDSLPERPGQLSADRGYDAQWPRNSLRRRHIQSAIPRRKTPQGQKRRKLTESAKAIFKNRWQVERVFAWLDGFRRLVTRWKYYPEIYHAFLSVAIICILSSLVLQRAL